MKFIVLSDRFSSQQVIDEQKQSWISETLLENGIKVEGNMLADISVLTENKVSVLEYVESGVIDIFRGSTLVAQWRPPQLFPKFEGSKVYYEIHFDVFNI